MSKAGLAATITLALTCTVGVAGAALPPPPGSFASRADKACAAAGAKVVALPTPTATTALPDLRSTRTILLALTARLRTIKAPTAKAPAYAAFVASIARHAAIIGQVLDAVGLYQPSRIAGLTRASDAVVKLRAAEAKALGLPACAKRYYPSATPSTGPPTTPKRPSGTTGVTGPTLVPAAAGPAAAIASPPPGAGSGSSGVSAGTSGATGGSTGVPAGTASQSGTQTFQGSSSTSQTVNTSGGVFVTG